MVSVSLAELVWLPTVTLAVLVRVSPGLPTRVALMVKVTLLPMGMAGIVIPAPCMSAMVTLPGQVAPPVVAEQVTLLTLILATARSLKTALLNATPVVLVMTTV